MRTVFSICRRDAGQREPRAVAVLIVHGLALLMAQLKVLHPAAIGEQQVLGLGPRGQRDARFPAPLHVPRARAHVRVELKTQRVVADARARSRRRR